MGFKVGIVLENLKLELREGCRKALAMGVDSVQLHFEHPDINLLASDRVRRKEEASWIRALGLEISGVCCLPNDEDYRNGKAMRRAFQSWLELALDLGAPAIPTRLIGVFKGIGQTPFGPMHPPEFSVTEAIGPVVEAAAREGITFAHETGLEPPEDVRDFIDSFSSAGIGVNYDPANLRGFGFDWIGGVEVIGKRIVHVHAKDARRSPEGRFEETALGQGQVGYDNFLRALARIGYSGHLAMERESTPDILADMTAGARFLRERIAELEQRRSNP